MRGISASRVVVPLAGVLALVAVLAAFIALGDDQEASTRRAPDLSVGRLDGPGRLELSDFPNVPVLVNFWASWCAPCRDEMPELQALAEEFQGRLAVVGVNAWDGRSAALQLLEELRISYPNGREAGEGTLADFKINSLPSTAFITADRRYVALASGRATGAELRAMLHEHLGLR